jgi:DNA-binding GntR family transcriptional regulator
MQAMGVGKNTNEDLEEYAYRFIIHQIVENQVRPGDTILETEMAKILNVSRTPVRSAIARLVNEGLLEKKRKKGCIIPTPEPDDAKQIFQAREILESKVAGLAALNRSEADLAQLWKILEKETNALKNKDKEEYYLANEELHFTLIQSAKNKYFERYCKHLFRKTSVYIFYFDSFYTSHEKFNRLPRQRTPGQHLEIVQAIEKQDAASAEKIMKDHVKYSYTVLFGLNN